MEKSQSMSGGQVFVQSYWKQIADWIMRKKIDPTFVISHQLPFEQLPEGYKMMAHRLDNCIKVTCQTDFGSDAALHHGVSNPIAARNPPEVGGAAKDWRVYIHTHKYIT
jgi:hypothetical protein